MLRIVSNSTNRVDWINWACHLFKGTLVAIIIINIAPPNGRLFISAILQDRKTGVPVSICYLTVVAGTAGCYQQR